MLESINHYLSNSGKSMKRSAIREILEKNGPDGLQYGTKLKGISLDENGMKPHDLEETIIILRELGHKIKFIYVIPDSQNPAGITLPDSGHNTMRINFSFSKNEEIETGVQRLSQVIDDELANK